MRAKPDLLCCCLSAAAVFGVAVEARGQTPTPGQNVNMVAGRHWPGGDPFLQRQNESSMAVSSRNPLHLLAGANDYRTVDLPLPDELPSVTLTGDAWLGLFKSFNGGQTWQSTLIPGYPQDLTPDGLASPLKVERYSTASDPVVRSGTNGLFYYAGIAFDRATNNGVVFVSRFIDLNNRENGNAAPSDPAASNTDPIRYNGTVVVDRSGASQFVDKPWIAVDVPRAGAATCNLQVAQADAARPAVTQTFAAGNVYLAYTKFTLDPVTGVPASSQLLFTRSRDCGATWSAPIALNAIDERERPSTSLSQGATIQVDPQAGFVYVAWRRFKGPRHPDSIVGAVSIDRGRTFTPGIPLWSLPAYDPANPLAPSFFDNMRATTQTAFRTNAFPTLAVDDSGFLGWPGRVYLAWSQRVPPRGDARIMMVNLPGSLLFTPAGLSLNPFPIDNGDLVDDTPDRFGRGHHFMPQMTFTGGKLLVLYYDMRLDHTRGTFKWESPPPPPSPPAPEFLGRFLENRKYVPDPDGDVLTDIFTPFVDDASVKKRRHTIDVVVAEAKPGFAPVFTVARVSRYKTGARPGSSAIEQLQFNPPGLPLFKGGTVPFFGDYLDIAGQMFVSKDGSWVFNTAPLSAPVHVATWTSNQDVRPPKDGNWRNYSAIGPAGPSIFDPSQNRLGCSVGQEGMRNQNIYFSRITEGMALSAPQNSKPLSLTLQRAFVVVLQNLTNQDRTFRLSIANQPAGGWASFLQARNISALPAPTLALELRVAAHSGIARSVFALSSVTTASITVTAEELSGSGLSSFVVLNPDGTTPPLINPEGTPADIASAEIYNPDVANPDVANPNELKSALANPDVANPDVANPDVANPDVANPDVANPDVANVNFMNPDVANPDVANPDVANPLVSDATYIMTNDGNTAASYTVKLVGTSPGGPVRLQLIINKRYLTPVNRDCNLVEEAQNTLQTNVRKPVIKDPAEAPNPDVANGSIDNATLSLLPGETALITLRGNVDVAAMKEIVSKVTPVAVAHAANTGTTEPAFSAPLTIRTTVLPDAIFRRPYSATLETFGGTPPYSWSLPFEGPLPPGLDLSTDGIISGTPQPPGGTRYTFTVQVTDARQRSQRAALSINVLAPLEIVTASFPTAITGFYYSTPPLLAAGGTPPYSWTVEGLPAGLDFNPATRIITGASSAQGLSPVTLTLVDSSRPPQRQSTAIELSTVDALAHSGSGAPGGGDLISRGFYIPRYPGVAIGQVRLAFAAITAGIYGFRLDVRSGAYDGPLIASANGTAILPGGFTFVETPFAFLSEAVERNSLVTFSIQLVEGPGSAEQVFYAVQCGGGPCGGPAIETNGTSPPLSTFRRNGVWLAILGAASATAPIVYTGTVLASDLNGPANGVLYRTATNDVLVTEYRGSTVTKIDAVSGARLRLAAVESPDEMAQDSAGNVYVKHEHGGPVWRFTALGTPLEPPSFSAPCREPTGTAFDAANNFYLACTDNGTIYQYEAGTTSSPLIFASGFPSLEGMGFSPHGELFVTDFQNGRIFQVSPGGMTLDAHPQWASGLEQPLNVAFDPLSGDMFASSTQRVVRISSPNTVTTFARGFMQTYDLDFDPSGCLYVDDFIAGELWKY